MRRPRYWKDAPRDWAEDWRNPDMMMYSSRTGKLFPSGGVNAICQKAYDKNGRPKRHGEYKPSVRQDKTYNKDGPPTKEQLKQVKTLAKAIQDDYILDSILKENP